MHRVCSSLPQSTENSYSRSDPEQFDSKDASYLFGATVSRIGLVVLLFAAVVIAVFSNKWIGNILIHDEHLKWMGVVMCSIFLLSNLSIILTVNSITRARAGLLDSADKRRGYLGVPDVQMACLEQS